MKTEEIIKPDAALSLSQKTLWSIMFTQNVLAESYHELLRHYDLSSEQFNVLKVLSELKGASVNMYLIKEKMITRTSNTTRLVDKLLLKGLLTREVCNNNRRKMEVCITGKGLKLLENISPIIADQEEKFACNLTIDEHENLNFLLQKYRNTRHQHD